MAQGLSKPAARSLLPPAVDLEVFRQMVDLSSEGFYLLDRRGRFLYVNAQGHAQMGGYTMEELLSLTVSDIAPDFPPERFAELVRTLEPGELPLIESWTRRKDGSMFLCEVSMARLDYAGETYLFGVARDITQRKADEALRTTLAATLLQTLESERRRVARELHDDVGQGLATVGVLIDALDVSPGAVPETVKPALGATRATITRITESLARIVREYHPVELLGLGLEDTLRTHARQFAERHKLALEVTTVPVEGLLGPEQELHVYRVVQEALTNAARHAQASRVRIGMTRTPDQLTVTVEDDGGGFDPACPPGHGIGLLTMRERATLLRGELTIESAAGRGTMVRLALLLGAEQASAPGVAGTATPATHPIEAVAESRTTSRPPGPPNAHPLPAPLDLEVFRKMADMSSEAFRLADSDGRFLYVNDRSGVLSGYTREEMYSMTVSDIAPDFPPDMWRRWVTAVQGPIRAFETRNRCKDGSIVPVEASITRLESHGESYFFAVIRDITDRKEIEASQQSFTRRLLHMLEAERHRVARELHDEVGQAVATVGVLLHTFESAAGSIPEDLRSGLAATRNTIRQITESVARIVRDYHPAELLGLGLEDSLRTHARHFAHRHGLVLRLATVPVEGLLSNEHALHVYRIVQEALANVARHARARRVTVRLARQGSRVTATVRDDGVGFDPESARPGGLGLVTMRERAALIGGVLAVRSTPGRGSEVRLSVAAETPRAGALAAGC